MLHGVVKSHNSKLGNIAATYRTIDSCPTTCPFYKNGCYANGRIFDIPRKYGGDEKNVLTRLFEKIPLGGILRHHVSGDIGSPGEATQRPPGYGQGLGYIVGKEAHERAGSDDRGQHTRHLSGKDVYTKHKLPSAGETWTHKRPSVTQTSASDRNAVEPASLCRSCGKSRCTCGPSQGDASAIAGSNVANALGTSVSNGSQETPVDWKYVSIIKQLALKRPDVRHIFYTHLWRKLKRNPFPFILNASCETPKDIEQAVARGFEATIVVNEGDSLLGQTVAGKKIIQCPQEYLSGVTCESCGLCSRVRNSVVAFVVHGPQKNKASAAVSKRREQ